MMTTIRAYLGGSFDPVHTGHLMMATHVLEQLSKHCPQQDILVHLLPTIGNPFKGLPTGAHHRLAMLNLATQGTPLIIDEHELHQPPPAYTIDTVRFFRQNHPSDVLIFILGKDSLQALPTWKDSHELLNTCHFWVFDRAGTASPDNTLTPHLSNDLTDITSGHGMIYQDPTPIIDISSSQIRTWLGQNNPKANDFLPAGVADYIKEHALYGQSVL